jgi:hypothetical protein
LALAPVPRVPFFFVFLALAFRFFAIVDRSFFAISCGCGNLLSRIAADFHSHQASTIGLPSVSDLTLQAVTSFSSVSSFEPRSRLSA